MHSLGRTLLRSLIAIVFLATLSPGTTYAATPKPVPVNSSQASSPSLDILEKLANLLRSFQSFLASQPSSAVVPQQVAAGGDGGYAAANRIDNLANTTIQNPTITGGSISGASITGAISNTINSALASISDLTSNTITATNVSFTNATTTNFNILGTFAGAGLSSCSAVGEKLLWNASVRQFECGTDQDSGGAGFSTSSALHFSSVGLAFSTTSTDHWLTTKSLSAFSTTSTDYWKTQNNFHSTTSLAYNLATYDKGYFFSTTSVAYWDSTQFRWATTSTNAWLATKSTSNLAEGSNLYYADARVAAYINASSTIPNRSGVSFGDMLSWNGSSWVTRATSTIGLPTFTDLGSYLSLASWYATTTDVLDEGVSNLYFTTNRVAAVIAGTTTDALVEGIANRYYTDARVQTYLSGVNKGFFFSTTSETYFSSAGLSFSTTSTDYWKAQNNFFSTTSASAFLALYQGNAFSTTSAAYNLSTYDKGFFFSTTSVNYWDSFQFRWATTSSDAWFATKTTDQIAQGSTNLFYSNTLVNSFIAGSSSIPKTFASNTFTGANNFKNVTATGATTTSLSSNIASTSLLVISNVSNGLLNTAANGTVQATAFSGPLSFNNGTLTILQASGGASGYLASADWTSFNSRLSTSTLSLIDKGYFFSTTSASSFAAVGLAFSTTSSSFWSSVGLGHSTTSVAYQLSQNTTLGNSTSTAFFATTASSTNLFSSTAAFGSLTLSNALGVSNGGTGAASLTGLLQGNGSSALTAVGGSAGQFSYFNGANTLGATSSIFLATNGNVGIGTTSADGFTVATNISNNSPTQPGWHIGTESGTYNLMESYNTSGSIFDFSAASGRDYDFRQFFNPALNSLSFSASSTAYILTLLGNGNVGIGTTSPQAKLQIDYSDSSAVFDGQASEILRLKNTNITDNNWINLRFTANDANGAQTTSGLIGNQITSHAANAVSGDLVFGTRNAGTLSERMRITSAGNVGIGTTSPATTLAVQGVGHFYPSGTSPDNQYGGSIRVTQAATSGQYINLTRSTNWVWSIGTVYNTNTFAIGRGQSTDSNFNAPEFVLTTTGNVGIGTTTPANTLVVENNQNATTYAQMSNTTSGTAAGAGVRFDANAGGGEVRAISDAFTSGGDYIADSFVVRSFTSSSAGLVLAAGGSNPLRLQTNSVERIRIDSSGNVGIGTTTPSYRLDVSSNGSSARFTNTGNGYLTITRDNTSDLHQINYNTGSGSSVEWHEGMAPSSTDFTFWNSSIGANALLLNTNGNAVLAGTLTQNSDQRLKTDIQSLDSSSALAAIKSLNPVSYSWIDPARGPVPQYGFIAQEVQKIFPNLVATTSPTALTPDGTLSLNYSGFVAPLVAVVQNLIDRMNDFTDRFTTKELTFTRATGDEIDLHKLCLDDVCITKDQLRSLLENANVSGPSAPQQNSPPQSDASSPTEGDTSPPVSDAPPIVPEETPASSDQSPITADASSNQ